MSILTHLLLPDDIETVAEALLAGVRTLAKTGNAAEAAKYLDEMATSGIMPCNGTLKQVFSFLCKLIDFWEGLGEGGGGSGGGEAA